MAYTGQGSGGLEGIPRLTPEHQRRVTRGKWFEVVTVITLILAGTAFLIWRNSRENAVVDPARSVSESLKAIQADGYTSEGVTELSGRRFHTYRRALSGFECRVDLIGTVPDAPIETAVIWLTPAPGGPPSSPEERQDAVNTVSRTGQKLVHSTLDALEKASKTMTFVSGTKRPHDKGVAGTRDGWKLTYVTYREYDETGEPQPVLYLVLQRLSAGSNPELGAFNRTLYEAVEQGDDIKSALASGSPRPQ